ncbi:hypothetical protein Tco_0206947 [Tanacetum coccineum]
MDLGGPYHMTYMSDYFVDCEEYDNANLQLGNDRECRIRGMDNSDEDYIKYIWKALRENTYTLNSIWEESGQDCNSTRSHSRFSFQTVETSSTFLVTSSEHSKDDVKIHSDDVKIYSDDVKLTDSEDARRRFTG